VIALRFNKEFFNTIGAKLPFMCRQHLAEPDVLVEELKKYEAIAEADMLLLIVSDQLGVDYNSHLIELS
jgi:hypothetical protein